MAEPPDHGKLIGLSLIAGRDDIETVAATVKELGFDGMEVHAISSGPACPGFRSSKRMPRPQATWCAGRG
jgi:hypothetical protein